VTGLNGKTAIISGASRGMGMAIAEDFLNQGVLVACFSRRRTAQVDRIERIYSAEHFLFQEADMLNRESLRSFLSAAKARFASFDLLVNNAGVAYDHVLPLTQDRGLDETLAVNLTNTIFLTRECLKTMWLNRSGSIVNIASIVGLRGYSGLSVYGASKAGLLGFTASLAREVGRLGIRVNAVCPGYVETDMTAKLNETQRDQIVRRTPLGRLGRPSDVVATVRFLASDEAAFITGQSIIVDGGISC
jgi:3-oxoacyl-[acyl-carrier protein] reductase